MNKKRYLILIALIIFIFLAIFTFANPLNNGEKNNNRILEEIEEEDVIKEEDNKEENNKEENNKEEDSKGENNKEENNKEEDSKEEDSKNENNKEENNKEESKPVVPDDSYELALNAVIKAEIILSMEKYQIATGLVEKVKDESNKEELSKRLDSVLEVIELKNLINTLLNDIKSATNKADMNRARNYKEENNIKERLSKIENEVVKELLQEKLDSIAYLLDDTNEPEINIVYGAMLNKKSEKKIEVTDENEVTITLNGVEINNEYLITGDGKYELVVVDAAFNSKFIKFIVDTVSPNPVDVECSSEVPINDQVTVTIIFDEEVKEVEDWILSDDKKVLTRTFTENETDMITVEDLAGNTVEVEYSVTTIDKVVNEPKVEYSSEGPTNGPVTVKIIFDEEVKEVEDWRLSEDKKVLTRTFEDRASGSVVIQDLAGNTVEVLYNVEHIDIILPKETTSNDNWEEFINAIFGVYTFSEEVIISYNGQNITNEYSTEFYAERGILSNRYYELTATDRAGNSITFIAYMKRI